MTAVSCSQICAVLLLGIICSVHGYYKDQGCACPYNYDPVCGVDGKTYPNLCSLRCAGVPLWYPGECNSPSCPCPKIYNPVCGVDGRTYDNLCILRCRLMGNELGGVKLAYYGECEKCPPPVVACFAPPCLVTTCPRIPQAVCVNSCNCRAKFFLNGYEVTRFCRRGKKIY